MREAGLSERANEQDGGRGRYEVCSRRQKCMCIDHGPRDDSHTCQRRRLAAATDWRRVGASECVTDGLGKASWSFGIRMHVCSGSSSELCLFPDSEPVQHVSATSL